MTVTNIPYLLITAFSDHVFGGNPAVVFFTDVNRPDEIYKGIATTLKQPMAAFISPKGKISPETSNIASFDIRYFAPSGTEAGLCGHATLAAAKAIFSDENRIPPEVDVIEFHNIRCQVFRATRVGNDTIEMRLPSCVPEEVSEEKKAHLTPLIYKAFGRKVEIVHIAEGTGNYGKYVMIEIKEEEDLKNSVVDPEPLRQSGYLINVITTASSSGKEKFVSRMFCPLHITGGEDMVCGTAHCVMGPYWYKKYGIPAGEEVKARQVSPRGGELNLVWLESENTMVLRGSLTILGRGELCL
ncbi:hypothetical protein AMATHDRAFT_70291 [Amanita thiersii Skay4041]|uniref:Diaminopimelate epimerase-like protein n=1 Tax=Amanita thiersii Skay4041 TaxID=703135 RepID=A0A2A9NEU1_9AGAR|nr:hypothetical protein AMATHDRAFT_70291 [Amanita thiersii Skay4041]